MITTRDKFPQYGNSKEKKHQDISKLVENGNSNSKSYTLTRISENSRKNNHLEYTCRRKNTRTLLCSSNIRFVAFLIILVSACIGIVNSQEECPKQVGDVQNAENSHCAHGSGGHGLADGETETGAKSKYLSNADSGNFPSSDSCQKVKHSTDEASLCADGGGSADSHTGSDGGKVDAVFSQESAYEYDNFGKTSVEDAEFHQLLEEVVSENIDGDAAISQEEVISSDTVQTLQQELSEQETGDLNQEKKEDLKENTLQADASIPEHLDEQAFEERLKVLADVDEKTSLTGQETETESEQVKSPPEATKHDAPVTEGDEANVKVTDAGSLRNINVEVPIQAGEEDYQIKEQLHEAQDTFSMGNLPEALEMFEEILKSHPESPRGKLGKGMTIDEMSKRKRCNRLLNEAIALFTDVLYADNIPDHLFPVAAEILSERLHFKGAIKEGIALQKFVINKQPNNTEALNQLGQFYLMQRKTEEAKKVFTKVLEIDPENGLAHAYIGSMYQDDKEYEKAIDHLQRGIDSNATGTKDIRFFNQLGVAYQRLGREAQARKVYEYGAELKLFLSKDQRSPRNVDYLTSRPIWTLEQTTYKDYLQTLIDNWEVIRDEAVALTQNGMTSFEPEQEGLTDKGEWLQLDLFDKGRREVMTCKRTPKTCALIEKIPPARTCGRGQTKFSIMLPGIHVWPHVGPTNTRLRAHLGLVIPEGPVMRVVNETRTWKAGELMVFDDSFEHEVWHNGTEPRLILIIDLWHPDLDKEAIAEIVRMDGFANLMSAGTFEQENNPMKKPDTPKSSSKGANPDPGSEDTYDIISEPETMHDDDYYERYDATWREDEEDFKIKSLLDEAEEVMDKLEYSEALELFEKILEDHPSSPRALFGKARTIDEMSKDERSNVLLEQAISLYSDILYMDNVHKDLAIFVGESLSERMGFRGWGDQSIKVIKYLLEKFPGDIAVQNRLGQNYLIAKQEEKAREVFMKVLETNPEDGFANAHLGFILKTQDNDYEKAVYHLQLGVDSGDKKTKDMRFYNHLGEAYQRLGREEEARKVYKEGEELGLFISRDQRSPYNVKNLTSRPIWTLEQTTYKDYLQTLIDNWQVIRDEGLALTDKNMSSFKREDEGLTEVGDWFQYNLFDKGAREHLNCKRAPKTCALIEKIPPARTCGRGQTKFSIMLPGIHVWPHVGPTNARLRAHLGLVIPEGPVMRVVNETVKWKPGELMVFDDSFEHEVWHNGTEPRLILIIDLWHPEIDEKYHKQLTFT